MLRETLRLDFASVDDCPALMSWRMSDGKREICVDRLGARRIAWSYKGARILALIMVRLARWQHVPQHLRPAVIPVMEGRADPNSKAVVSDAVSFGGSLEHVHKYQWLREKLCFDEALSKQEADQRASRWFELRNAAGRSKKLDRAHIGIRAEHLPPEAVSIMLDGNPVTAVQLDRLERRLSMAPPLHGSWPPLSDAWPLRLAGFLPSLSPKFVGRTAELAELDALYERGQCRFAIISGAPGQGKTTLAGEWLRERMAMGKLKQALVFAWSFYHQGYTARSGQWMHDFYQQLGASLGVPIADHDVPTTRAKALCAAMCKQPTFLFLDGLEVLLRPGCGLPGEIQDETLATLAEMVAFHRAPGSFIMATSRQLLGGPLRSSQPEVQHWYLHDLLQQPASHLPQAPEQSCTALEWTVIGWSTDVSAAEQLLAQVHSETGADRLRNLVRHRLNTLTDDLQRAILLGIALFDRPAEWEYLHPLLTSEPELPGLTPQAAEPISDEAWTQALEALSTVGILRVTDGGALEIHPEIRRCLADDFSRSNPRTWAAAQGRLREHFAAIPQHDTPDTLEELEPLFRAVWHGCQAGEFELTNATIALPRISRGTSGYIMDQLGAYSEGLTLLEYACPDHLHFPPASDLNISSRIHIVAGIVYCLERLNRLEESYRAAQFGWSLIGSKQGVDCAGLMGCNMLRQQHIHGDLDKAMPVMKRMLRAFMAAPLSPETLSVPPHFISQALGWTAVNCGQILWDLGKTWRTQMLLKLALMKCRSLLGKPRMTLLPAAVRFRHASLLLDMGEWRVCAEALDAGELNNPDLESRRNGFAEYVLGRITSAQSLSMKPGPHHDELSREAVSTLEAALTIAQMGRFAWVQARVELALAAHHFGSEKTATAEKHRFQALRIAEKHGFKLIKKQAEALK